MYLLVQRNFQGDRIYGKVIFNQMCNICNLLLLYFTFKLCQNNYEETMY